MRLSDNFTLDEFTRSQTAVRRGIDNTPDVKIVARLERLVLAVLQPVRVHFDSPIRISSGYRSPALNRAIGGARTSQHTKGEAADFTVSGHSNLEVCKWIEANLAFDQLIYEFGEKGWIHCSYKMAGNRQQVLRAVRLANGRTRYLPGLEAPAND